MKTKIYDIKVQGNEATVDHKTLAALVKIGYKVEILDEYAIDENDYYTTEIKHS